MSDEGEKFSVKVAFEYFTEKNEPKLSKPFDVKLVISEENFTEALNTWFLTNEKEVKMIADKAINAKKARDAAKKARDNIREKQAKKEKAVKFDSKLADCYSKNRSKCEIYITEGNSASGNLKEARDNEFQAVLPVRGKCKSCPYIPNLFIKGVAY